MREMPSLSGPVLVLALALLMGGNLLLPRAAAGQEPVYKPDQVSEQPKIADPSQAKTAISRSYTLALQEMGLEGRVEVAFIVNADGTVDPASIRVIKSPAEALAKAAEVAVAKIKFQPAKKDGQPVRCEAVMAVVYQRGS